MRQREKRQKKTLGRKVSEGKRGERENLTPHHNPPPHISLSPLPPQPRPPSPSVTANSVIMTPDTEFPSMVICPRDNTGYETAPLPGKYRDLFTAVCAGWGGGGYIDQLRPFGHAEAAGGERGGG